MVKAFLFSIFFIFLTINLSCTTSPKLNRVNDQKNVFSHPNWESPQESHKHIKKIVVVSTSNFLDDLNYQEEKYTSIPDSENKSDKNKDLILRVGGIPILSTYLNILREKFPSQTLLIDSGNTHPLKARNRHEAKKKLNVYEFLKYDAVNLSDGHFLTQLNQKKGRFLSSLRRMKFHSKAPFVSSNLIDLKTGKPFRSKYVTNYKLVEVNEVKIGILGVTHPQVFKNKSTSTYNGLYLDDMAKSIIVQSRKAMRKGAQVIVVMANLNQKCPQLLRGEISEKPFPECTHPGDLSKLINKLPPRLVDLFVAGGNQGPNSTFINGIPVIQTENTGKYIGRIELYYDQSKDQILSNQTTFYHPTKLCHSFIEQTEDCFGKHPNLESQELIIAKFLGLEVIPDQNIAKKIQ